MNKFAIEGKYLNFLTSGKWLWDKVSVPVPSGKVMDRAVMDEMTHLVKEQTRTDTAEAVRKWSHNHDSQLASEFGSAPMLHLPPSHSGRDLVIRYVTQAQNCFAIRARLRRDLLSILQPY